MTASSLLPTYARAELAFERGDGAWLTSTTGERYLDFGSGVAVNALGHSHPHLVQTLVEQGQKLWHVSNLYQIPQAEALAKKLTSNTFADLVFFTNSGAEALEGLIKTARKYHAANHHPERFHIITFEGAFHGRTLATIAAGGNPKYIEGFGPKVEGFIQVPMGDEDAVRDAITPETAGILIEPVQGEGGVRVVPAHFLRFLRDICDEHGLLLLMDEVQTGVGRTGRLFAHEACGVTPDIMAVAKGIGGGFPLGAFLATSEAGKGMIAGTHGSTYGGNPLATAVGSAVLDVVLGEGFLDHVVLMGLKLRQRLAELRDRHPTIIEEIRGEGLLLGLKTIVPNTDFVAAVRKQHMLTIPAGENVVRLLPPLIIGEAEINEAFTRLDAACVALKKDALIAHKEHNL